MDGPLIAGEPDFGSYTAAEPGFGKSFSEWLLPDYTGKEDEIHALASRAEEYTRLANLSSSRNEAMAEAAELRVASIKRATGQDLENPYRGGYRGEAMRRVRERAALGEVDLGRSMNDRALEEQRKIFDDRVGAIAQEKPELRDHLGLDTPIEQRAAALADTAEQALAGARARAVEAGIGGPTRFVNEVVGGIWGARRDPLTVGSMAVGPTGAIGRQVLVRIVAAGVTQGLFNVGLEAVKHPAVAAWREERGKEPGGMLPSLEETALAFASGFIPGVGIHSVVELARGIRPPPSVLKAAENSAAADHTMLEDLPPGVTPEQHAETLSQAVKHVNDPASEPPAPLPIGANAQERMAGLSDEAWSMVRDGRADPEHAQMAVELGAPPERQAAVLSRVADLQPRTREEAAVMVADAIEAEGGLTGGRVPEPERSPPVRGNAPAAALVAEGGGKAPARAPPPGLEDLRGAYETAVREQGGISTLPISKLIEMSGVPKEDVHRVLLAAAQEGTVSLHKLSSAPARFPEQTAAAIHLPDGEQLGSVVFKDAAAKAGPREGPMKLVPMAREEDGSPALLTPEAVAKVGERHIELADLVRSCK